MSSFLEIGKSYFIRTVTMYTVGKLKAINNNEFLLEQASWVADCGRFSAALKTGTLDEVEPFVDDVVVNRGSIVDITEWRHNLPTEQI